MPYHPSVQSTNRNSLFVLLLKHFKNALWTHPTHIRFPYVLTIIAACLSLITYFALSRSLDNGQNDSYILALIYSDGIILLLLTIMIAKRLYSLWIEHKKGLKGSKLHIQLVALFSCVSIIPAILVAIFSVHFLNVGVNTWFGQPVRNALQQANQLAESYLEEHKKVLSIDIFELLHQIRPQIKYYLQNPEILTQRLNEDASAHQLTEMMVLHNQKKFVPIARSDLTFLPLLEDLTSYFKKAAKTYNTPILIASKDHMRAIIKIDPLTDTYLFIGKSIDPNVLQQVDKTSIAYKNYRLSSDHYSEVQVTFVLFFSIVSLLLLMSAIWIGLTIADMIVKPIIQLIAAAESVSGGDLSIKLPIVNVNTEIDDLCRSFNRMTHQLAQQKHDLILSEKKSAWADMARKIAHEIKNPLTPIQLSAERLKRRYLKEIQNDPTTFQACIDTIIRQVNSIGSLVTEFSNFARMPEPKLEPIDIVMLCQETMILQQQANPSIMFLFDAQFPTIVDLFDPMQISQVLTNLIQNSINVLAENSLENRRSIIKIRLFISHKILYIKIEDSGPGFPIHEREKLLEPYYTTRDKGTGLGLAIVSKIVSDHNGRMELLDSEDLGGACVLLSFPLKQSM